MLNRYKLRVGPSVGIMIVAIFCASLVGCGGKASAEISEARARSDMQEVIMITAGSLMNIGRFEVLSTESPFEGRLYVDVEVELKAKEAALADSVAEQNRKKQMLGSAYRNRSADRDLMMARQADGRIEKIRLTYKQTSGDMWELQDFGALPSKYALEQRENGIGPTESEVLEELGRKINIAMAGQLSLVSLEIKESEVLANDHVKMKISMQLKGDASLLKENSPLDENIVVTEDSFIQTAELEIAYKQQGSGKWKMEDL